jgi:hypothetical protein
MNIRINKESKTEGKAFLNPLYSELKRQLTINSTTGSLGQP